MLVVARQIRSGSSRSSGTRPSSSPAPGSGPRAQKAASAAAGDIDAVWDQPGITEASEHHVPLIEYEDWVRANSIEVVLCDENYQFDEINHLREQGVRTIGRFVWEYFGDEYVHGAKTAFDTIYSLSLRERDRYRDLGIDSPYVPWGIHPELLEPAAVGADRDPDIVRHYFPGSFLGRRKPIRKVVKAFGRASGDQLRLVISAQVPNKDEFLQEAAAKDPRIELALTDDPEEVHRARFASCDVCLAPSRWEGLGLPLDEATAFGLPIITNDKPPMSEMVLDGRSGLLVASVENGTTRSGVTAWDPEPGGADRRNRAARRSRGGRAHARWRGRAARAARLEAHGRRSRRAARLSRRDGAQRRV